jgi:hypothetical protein
MASFRTQAGTSFRSGKTRYQGETLPEPWCIEKVILQKEGTGQQMLLEAIR